MGHYHSRLPAEEETLLHTKPRGIWPPRRASVGRSRSSFEFQSLSDVQSIFRQTPQRASIEKDVEELLEKLMELPLQIAREAIGGVCNPLIRCKTKLFQFETSSTLGEEDEEERLHVVTRIAKRLAQRLLHDSVSKKWLTFYAPTRYALYRLGHAVAWQRDSEMAPVTFTGVTLLHLAAYFTSQTCSRFIDFYFDKVLDGKASGGEVAARAWYRVMTEEGEVQCSVQALHLAVWSHNVERVRQLLQHRADVECRSTFNGLPDFTPLQYARELREWADQEGLGHNLMPDADFQQIEEILRSKRADANGYNLLSQDFDLSNEEGEDQEKVEGWMLFRDELDTLQKVSSHRAGVGLFYDARELLREADEVYLKSPASQGRLVEVGDLNILLDNPLPPGYEQFGLPLLKGRMVHFAINRLFAHEDLDLEDVAADDLELLLKNRADISAKAFYLDDKKSWCSVTPLVYAVLLECVAAVRLLLHYGAPLEGHSTREDHSAAWTALGEAVMLGPRDKGVELMKLLLQERADPNGAAGHHGMACLHTAVQRNHMEAIRLLVAAGADVSQRGSRYTTTHGYPDVGTPISLVDYADRPYEEKEKSHLYQKLAPSLRGVDDLFSDICDHLFGDHFRSVGLDRLVEELLSGSWQHDAELAATVKPSILQARRDAATCAKIYHGDKVLEPLDIVVRLMEMAPAAGVRLLKELLLVKPDVEVPPLPRVANMRCQLLGSAFAYNAYMRTEYAADTNKHRAYGRSPRRRDREAEDDWPCWLREAPWHSALCPPTPPRGRMDGEIDVKLQVLLLANAIDIRLVKAISTVWTRELYAELVLQAIISCTYSKIAIGTVFFWVAMDFVLFLTFLGWSSAGPADKMQERVCWTYVAAVAFNQTFTLLWWWRSSVCTGSDWIGFFFSEFLPGFKLLRSVLLFGLLCLTATSGYSLNTLDGDYGNTQRSLLGASIVAQGFQSVLLYRGVVPHAKFGRHLQSIWHSFSRIGSMLLVLLFIYGSLSSAFVVMQSRLSVLQLMRQTYRGLILGDGDGLNALEGEDGGEQVQESDVFLTTFSTFIVTVCLLNVSVAVFQSEYEEAQKNSHLLYWKHRAKLCSQVLHEPRWPWCGEPAICPERQALSGLISLAAEAAQCLHHFWSPCISPEVDDTDSFYYGLVGKVTLLCLLCWALVLLLSPRCHAVFSATALGTALVLLQALTSRSLHGGAEDHCRERRFLWVCFRADFNRKHFIAEEAEKEQIEALETELHEVKETVKSSSECLGEILKGLTEMERTVNTFAERLESLEMREVLGTQTLTPRSGAVTPRLRVRTTRSQSPARVRFSPTAAIRHMMSTRSRPSQSTGLKSLTMSRSRFS